MNAITTPLPRPPVHLQATRPVQVVNLTRAARRPYRDVATPGGVFLLNPRALR